MRFLWRGIRKNDVWPAVESREFFAQLHFDANFINRKRKWADTSENSVFGFFVSLGTKYPGP